MCNERMKKAERKSKGVEWRECEVEQKIIEQSESRTLALLTDSISISNKHDEVKFGPQIAQILTSTESSSHPLARVALLRIVCLFLSSS